MSTARILELIAAIAVLGFGIWLYRRRKSADQGYGSQGAVLLFAVAAIMAIHALGGLDYRPSHAEADLLSGRSR